jgi:hypothetical protein
VSTLLNLLPQFLLQSLVNLCQERLQHCLHCFTWMRFNEFYKLFITLALILRKNTLQNNLRLNLNLKGLVPISSVCSSTKKCRVLEILNIFPKYHFGIVQQRSLFFTFFSLSLNKEERTKKM